MPPPTFNSCQYSAFFSYAHDDDAAWRWWVTEFSKELQRNLASRLHGLRVPSVHLSSEDGPINGPLDDALRERIERSFAMVVFVHDGYLQSEWCLQEIRHFKARFGDAGIRDRLFIVAMSRSAIESLTARPSWRELFSAGDQVWQRFFQEDAPDEPVDVYADDRRKRKLIIANDFWDEFKRLCLQMVATIKASVAIEQAAPSYPQSRAIEAVAVDPRTVHVYIESNPEFEAFSEPLGQQVVDSWDQIMAMEQEEPPLRLRPTGLPLGNLHDRPVLDDANGVILLWGRKTPDSLMAQINVVEPKLSGPDFAPGLIAYLMDGARDQPPASTLSGWPVVRFMTRPDGSATVVFEDAPVLARFLRDVLAHKRAR